LESSISTDVNYKSTDRTSTDTPTETSKQTEPTDDSTFESTTVKGGGIQSSESTKVYIYISI